MIQLLLHLWGDYILQNHWMATKKTEPGWKGVWACTIHVVLYMLPFQIFLQPSPLAFTVMYITHWYIDRYRLAKYLIWLVNWGYPKRPDYLGVWLLIIADNILHVTINYLALTYL